MLVLGASVLYHLRAIPQWAITLLLFAASEWYHFPDAFSCWMQHSCLSLLVLCRIYSIICDLSYICDLLPPHGSALPAAPFGVQAGPTAEGRVWPVPGQKGCRVCG